MIIVLEGPDGAGKTSLQGAIVEVGRDAGYCVEPVHVGPPPAAPQPGSFASRFNLTAGIPRLRTLQDMMTVMDDVTFILENEQPTQETLVVIDRFHVGPAVYGEVFRPHDSQGDGFGELGLALTNEIDVWVAHRGISVLVTAHPMILASRIAESGDEYLDVDRNPDEAKMSKLRSQVTHIDRRYRQVVPNLQSFGSRHPFVIDTSQGPYLKPIARELIRAAHNRTMMYDHQKTAREVPTT